LLTDICQILSGSMFYFYIQNYLKY
jgi:hypothetical protein